MKFFANKIKKHKIIFISLLVLFVSIAVFGLYHGMQAAVSLNGDWLQTDSSTTQTGFNFSGNGTPAVGSSNTNTAVSNSNGGVVELGKIANTQVGWAVGHQASGGGAIRKTTDGGNTWVTQNTGITGDIYLRDVFFLDTNTGWAVGVKIFSGPIIIKTVDGGNTWATQTCSSCGSGLKSVFFIDLQNGWVVGQDGIIKKTSDGGSTWVTQTSGTAQTLETIQFIDSQTGWISGWNGVILKTTNGGSTWNAQTSGTIFNLYDIYFIDSNTGWTTGVDVGNANGIAKKTIDGGNTWATSTVSAGSQTCINFTCKSVFFLNANIGWFSGFNSFFSTINGGSTWTFFNNGGNWTNDIVAFDQNNIIIITDYAILKATAGGSSLTSMPVTSFDNGAAISFPKVYAPSGTYTSAVFNTNQQSIFDTLTFNSTIPTGYNKWVQDNNIDFTGTNSTTTVSGNSVKLKINAGAGIIPLDLGVACSAAQFPGAFTSFSGGICTVTTTSSANTFNFTTITIPLNTTLRALGTNALTLKATGDVNVSGGIIDLNGNAGTVSGRAGGAGGYAGGLGTATTGNSGLVIGGNGGGGGGSDTGGGGGGYGGIGGDGGGSGGVNHGQTDTGLNGGGGGGGGGGYGGSSGGNGGGGGGFLKIISGGTISNTGTIRANGGGGANGAGGSGGGGGAGGRLNLIAANISGSGTYSVIGGTGGNGILGEASGGGGGGGGRLIFQNFAQSMSDGTMIYSGGNGGSGYLTNPAGTNGDIGSYPTPTLPTSYFTSGTYTSPIKQIPAGSTLGTIDLIQTVPASTTMVVSVRTCSNSSCGVGSTSGWQTVTDGTNLNTTPFTNYTGYIQYKADLSTTDTTQTPSLDKVTINVIYDPITIYAKSCNDPICSGETWTQIATGTTVGTATSSPFGLGGVGVNQYAQYKIDLVTMDSAISPTINEINIGYNVRAGFNFSITAVPPNEITITAGSAGLSADIITSISYGNTPAATTTFSISPADLPANTNAIFSDTSPCSTPADCDRAVTFSASPTAIQGEYIIPIKVTAIEGSLTIKKEITYKLIISAPFDFAMAWTNTDSLSVPQNGSASINLDVTKIAGINDDWVNLSHDNTNPNINISLIGSCFTNCTASNAVSIQISAINNIATTSSPIDIKITGKANGDTTTNFVTLHLSITAGYIFSMEFTNNNSQTLSGWAYANSPASAQPGIKITYISGPTATASTTFAIINPDPINIITTTTHTGHVFSNIGEIYNYALDISVGPNATATTYQLDLQETMVQGINNKRTLSYFLTVYPPYDFAISFSSADGYAEQGSSVANIGTLTIDQSNNPTPKNINFTTNFSIISTSTIPISSISIISPPLNGTSSLTTDNYPIIVNISSTSTTEFDVLITTTGTEPETASTHSATTTLHVSIPPFDYNVRGWAWSDNIGWISFNSQNCDTDRDGAMDRQPNNIGKGSGDSPPYAGLNNCPIDGTPIPNYGVQINTDGADYELSGFAWSENIGWITFDKSTANISQMPPFPINIYDFDTRSFLSNFSSSTSQIEGWARAVSCNYNASGTLAINTGCDSNDEWGWIKMSGTSTDGVWPYSTKITAKEFNGYAWGGDVIGWISFNYKNCDQDGNNYIDTTCGGQNDATTPSSKYMVTTITMPNKAPEAREPNSNFINRCAQPLNPKFNFTYFDKDNDPLKQYTIKVYNSTGTTSVADDILIGQNTVKDANNADLAQSGSLIENIYNTNTYKKSDGTTDADRLVYGEIYYFTVEVRDEAHLN